MPVYINHSRLPVVLHLLPPRLPTPMINAVSCFLHSNGDVACSCLSYHLVYKSLSLVLQVALVSRESLSEPTCNTQVSQIQRPPLKLQGYVHTSVKKHLKQIQLDISAFSHMRNAINLHISVLMCLPQQRLLPQAKESLTSQLVEKNGQKAGATFQPWLRKIKKHALGCWQLLLSLEEGHKNDKQNTEKMVNHSRKTRSIFFCPEVFHYNHKL